MGEMILPYLNTLLNERFIFPHINILLEGIHAIELLLEGLLFIRSGVVDYLEWEKGIFHPLSLVMILNFFIQLWNNMYHLIPSSSVFFVKVKFRYFVVMEAAEPV